jgi:hypothetical protein
MRRLNKMKRSLRLALDIAKPIGWSDNRAPQARRSFSSSPSIRSLTISARSRAT